MNKQSSVFLTIQVHCIRCGSPEEADDSAGGTAKNPAEVQRRPERVAASTLTSFTLDLFFFSSSCHQTLWGLVLQLSLTTKPDCPAAPNSPRRFPTSPVRAQPFFEQWPLYSDGQAISPDTHGQLQKAFLAQDRCPHKPSSHGYQPTSLRTGSPAEDRTAPTGRNPRVTRTGRAKIKPRGPRTAVAVAVMVMVDRRNRREKEKGLRRS